MICNLQKFPTIRTHIFPHIKNKPGQSEQRAGFPVTHLPPVLEEVLAEDILCRVLVVQHLAEEARRFFCLEGEVHGRAVVGELHVRWEGVVGRSKVGALGERRGTGLTSSLSNLGNINFPICVHVHVHLIKSTCN